MGLIRFLLACGVVLTHTSTIEGYSPVNSNLAVQCFYIISGYYMALILTEKYTGKGSQYLFYTNRALKIYPVYWLNLILLLILNLLAFTRGYPGNFDFYFKYQPPSFGPLCYFILSNLLIIGLDWTFFFGINQSGDLFLTRNFNATNPNVYNYAFNSIAWTVGLELLFYAFAPWLNKQKWWLLFGLLLVSLLLRIAAVVFWFDLPPWSYMFFPTQVMFFMAGMLSYKFIKVSKLNWGKHLKTAIYLLLLAVVLFYYQVFTESYYKQAVLFLCITLCMPFAFDLTKKSKFDRLLGNLSYPIYITQELAIHLTTSKRFPNIIDRGLTTLLLDILLSVIIYKTVTVYIERIRANRVKQFKQA